MAWSSAISRRRTVSSCVLCRVPTCPTGSQVHMICALVRSTYVFTDQCIYRMECRGAMRPVSRDSGDQWQYKMTWPSLVSACRHHIPRLAFPRTFYDILFGADHSGSRRIAKDVGVGSGSGGLRIPAAPAPRTRRLRVAARMQPAPLIARGKLFGARVPWG